ncbi:tripartite tricarboxylate transporter substrate binding protein [Bradyrhizobium sp. URHD0069]|uniref:Bug family tripartite tricarboxylate transporter substrate binding protein n=1 Tax=Bradyrhizobium sp. URHD0069 TaxID=1380355 RepID=UPI00049504CA|nr:tripartite tricarboxylate transporter substrate binding protein [Bradyrhizobium sp. URHD0069]
MIKLSRILLSAILLFGFASAGQALDFPTRFVRIIIPYPPGGSSDAQARTLAQQLSKIWKQQVIVENKPGAGTTIGATFAASATPDGYTLYLNSVSHAIVPSLYKNLRYDPIKSFEPVSRVASSPVLLLVNSASGINSAEELLALARSKPGKLNYATPGVGSSPYLAAEMMTATTKIEVEHIPFNGAGPSATALLGRVIDFAVSDVTALPFVKDGVFKALAVTSPERFFALPDVPTFSEAIEKGFEATNWSSILVPAGTPKEIVDFLNKSIRTALESPEVKTGYELQGFQATPSTPEELRDLMASEITKYRNVLEKAGVKPQ